MKWLSVELSLLLLVSLVAFAGFVSFDGSSEDFLTGDLSFGGLWKSRGPSTTYQTITYNNIKPAPTPKQTPVIAPVTKTIVCEFQESFSNKPINAEKSCYPTPDSNQVFPVRGSVFLPTCKGIGNCSLSVTGRPNTEFDLESNCNDVKSVTGIYKRINVIPKSTSIDRTGKLRPIGKIPRVTLYITPEPVKIIWKC